MELLIAGSPRKGMYSDRLAEAYAAITGAEIIHARSVSVNPCHGCAWCKGKGNGRCVQKDDMNEILEKARKAEGIAIFSPIYWWQLTAQTKLIIDRLYPLSEEEWKGKMITVVVNGAAEDDDKEFGLLKEQFREMTDYIHADYRFLGVGTSDDESAAKALEKVRKLAAENMA